MGHEEYISRSNIFLDKLLGIQIFRRSNEQYEPQPKIWYYQDRYRENPEKEVELGMDSNVSYSRIYTTPDLSLVMKSFTVADAGIYRCHGKEGQEKEDKYNYRIERKINNNVAIDITFYFVIKLYYIGCIFLHLVLLFYKLLLLKIFDQLIIRY